MPSQRQCQRAIVADVIGQTDASDDEDAVAYHAHAFNMPVLSQALYAVDLLRRFYGAHGDGENGNNGKGNLSLVMSKTKEHHGVFSSCV